MSFLCCPLKTLTLCPSIAYTAIGYLKETHIYLCIWNTVWDRNTNHNSGCFHSRKSEPEFMFFFVLFWGFFAITQADLRHLHNLLTSYHHHLGAVSAYIWWHMLSITPKQCHRLIASMPRQTSIECINEYAFQMDYISVLFQELWTVKHKLKQNKSWNYFTLCVLKKLCHEEIK